ncbi:putative dynein heavy chain-like protein [Erysiphe neolycopersici]|uniref:Putative dynein heavy chain-like protein n=1 Tax=Erysiphe neolycopersici TaxID=212602 RepID=A0A420HZP7_9PEZI|nr:putative dynein heavy chain-like protein [Erysiphe neolycopersici]
MDCSWVKNIAKRRPSQPPPFYENKKGTFDSEKICLGLGIDEIHYTKLLEYINYLIGPNSLKSKALTRDIRRRLRKTLDPILHNLPPAWAAKCIDQLILKASSSMSGAKRGERGRALEAKKDIPQNPESRYSIRASSSTRVEPSHDVPISIRQAPTQPGWPAAGYQLDSHAPRDPTQFPRRRLLPPTSFDTNPRRNSEGVTEDIIRPPSVHVKRELEPDDNIISRPSKGYIVSREPTEINRQISRATMDRYIPEFETDRFMIRNSYPPDIMRAPEDRSLEERARERRALEERARDERIRDERAREERIREERIREERIREERIRDERIRDERIREERLIEERARERRVLEERARDRRGPEEWPRERRAPDLWAPERRAPDLWAPDRRAPERRVHDRWAPEGRASDRWAPEIRAPERRAPEARALERRAPEVRAPERRAPEGKLPEGRALEKRVTEIKGLETKTLGGNVPDAKIPEVKASEEISPVVKVPEMNAEELKAPESKVLVVKNQEIEASEEKVSEEKTLVKWVPGRNYMLTPTSNSVALVPEKQAQEDQNHQILTERATEQQVPKDQAPAIQNLESGAEEGKVLENPISREKITELQAPDKHNVTEIPNFDENPSQKILPGDIDIDDRVSKTTNDDIPENSTSVSNHETKQEPLAEAAFAEQNARKVSINQMAFMARRDFGDWVLLGTGNDLMGVSGAPDWDIFLSRLKVGLKFSLETDGLFCPWLGFTNGEELVGIFDSFGWRAGIGNMYQRGLSELRFEVKKCVTLSNVNPQQQQPNQPEQQQQQMLQESLVETEIEEVDQDVVLARSSSLSSLDSYNDQ